MQSRDLRIVPTFIPREHWKHFRKTDAPHLATEVYRGVVFEDGVKLTKSNQRAA